MRVPKYRKNPDGRAFVEYRSKRHYLGQYGTAESKAKYKQFIARIMAERDEPALPLSRDPLLLDLAETYAEYAEAYYTDQRDYSAIRTTLEQIVSLYPDTTISDFGPRKILVWQQWMIQQKFARTTINKRLGFIKQWLRWLASRELIDVSVSAQANTVAGLRAGKSAATESKPVQPVSQDDVATTLPFLPPPVAAMVQVQYLCGMRPQDVIAMRPGDIDCTGDIWLYRPARHKNTHRGQSLVKAIPKAAQPILAPFLTRDADAYCFDPRESSAWAYEQKRTNSKRTTKRYPCEERRLEKQKAKTARQQSGTVSQYKRYTYSQAVKRGCKKAGIDPWTPLQLRHSIATTISQTLGEQAAQRWLGHARLSTTGIYVEKQVAELIAIAAQVDQIISSQQKPGQHE